MTGLCQTYEFSMSVVSTLAPSSTTLSPLLSQNSLWHFATPPSLLMSPSTHSPGLKLTPMGMPCAYKGVSLTPATFEYQSRRRDAYRPLLPQSCTSDNSLPKYKHSA